MEDIASSHILEQFAQNWYYFFLQCLVELIRMKPSGPEVYVCAYIKERERDFRRNRDVILYSYFKKIILAATWKIGKGH